MRELDRLDAQFGLGADPRQHRVRRQARGPFRYRHWREVTAGVVCTLVLGLMGWQLYNLWTPAGDGTYAFEEVQPTTHSPIGYDPCDTVHYVVNPDNGPPDYLDFIQKAVAEASRASGIRFQYDGTTTDRDFDRDRGPVLIGFADPSEVSDLGGEDVVGVGGSVSYVAPGDRRRYFHSGMVALKPSWFVDEDRHHRQRDEQAVVMHELGHVLGLAHVQDKHELMYPSLTRTSYGPGDVRGLEALGEIPC